MNKKEIEARFNAVFRPVHQSRHRYVVMKGSAGSGKSTDTAQFYILRLMEQKGRNLLVVRKSEASHRHSTFAELCAAIRRLEVEAYWQVSKSVMRLTCKNGNSIVFRGMNDAKQREKIKSIAFEQGYLTDIWLEEATEFSQEDMEILDDRMRGKLPPPLFYQMKLTFNPVSANHWIKRVFFDGTDENVLTHQSTYLDNHFIDQGFLSRMERRKRLDPEGYRIYGLGEWGETGGLILTNWSVEDVDINPENYDDAFIGQDFGYNDANAIVVVGVRDQNLYLLDELYVRELDTGEIIRLAEERKLPKQLPMYCDSAEPDRIKTWVHAGYRAAPVSKEPGSVGAQIDFLKGRQIYVHPRLKNTIRELGQWRWSFDERTGRYTDRPVGVEDHAMAALRYSIEGMRKPRKIIGLKI